MLAICNYNIKSIKSIFFTCVATSNLELEHENTTKIFIAISSTKFDDALKQLGPAALPPNSHQPY